jgi:putative NADH-flavin reductase
MVITIFGATGMVGSKLVVQALAKGFSVRAFGRNVEKLIDMDEWEDKFEAVKGYVFEEADVLDAMKGSEAVLSALGGSFDGKDKTRSLGMKNIVKQMQRAGVDRIIAVGGQGSLNANADSIIMDQPGFPAQYLPVAREHNEAFGYLKNTNLDWTFVCAPDLVNKDADGRFVTSANYPPAYNRNHISTGNLAAFMLSELNDNHYLQQRVGISDAS